MSERVTIWVVTPHESGEYDEWWGPAETDEDHDAAFAYAYDRLADLWDQYDSSDPRPVTVTMEQRDVPRDDFELSQGDEPLIVRAVEAGDTEVEQLRGLLKEVEWTRYTRSGVGCHFCRGGPGDDLNSPCKVHEPGCRLVAALDPPATPTSPEEENSDAE